MKHNENLGIFYSVFQTLQNIEFFIKSVDLKGRRTTFYAVISCVPVFPSFYPHVKV